MGVRFLSQNKVIFVILRVSVRKIGEGFAPSLSDAKPMLDEVRAVFGREQSGCMRDAHAMRCLSELIWATRSTGFPSDSPSFQSQEQNLPCHQEADDAHSHGIHEHSIQVVVNHTINRIAALRGGSAVFNHIDKPRGRLTLAMNMMPPAINPKDARSSVGGRDGRQERGGFRYTST